MKVPVHVDDVRPGRAVRFALRVLCVRACACGVFSCMRAYDVRPGRAVRFALRVLCVRAGGVILYAGLQCIKVPVHEGSSACRRCSPWSRCSLCA